MRHNLLQEFLMTMLLDNMNFVEKLTGVARGIPDMSKRTFWVGIQPPVTKLLT